MLSNEEFQQEISFRIFKYICKHTTFDLLPKDGSVCGVGVASMKALAFLVITVNTKRFQLIH